MANNRNNIIPLLHGATTPQWAMTLSLSRLHDCRHSTLGRTPLDE